MKLAFLVSAACLHLFAPSPSAQEILTFLDSVGYEAGTSAAFADGRLLVGAPGPSAQLTQRNGAVLVYERDGTDDWAEHQELSSPTALEEEFRFGTDLAASGPRLAVTAPNEGGPDVGAVHLFLHDGASYGFAQTFTFLGAFTDPPGFGISVALDGERLLVSDFSRDYSEARAFERLSGTWTKTQDFDDFVLFGSHAEHFGSSLALAGDELAIGASLSPQTGAVGLYDYDAGTNAWLYADFVQPTPTLSLSAGSFQTLRMVTDPALDGDFYVVLAFFSGTSPGFTLQGNHVPLNFDALTLNLIQAPNAAPFVSSFSTIGSGSFPAIFLPSGDPSLAGTTLSLATVLLDHLAPTQVTGTTNALSIKATQ